MMQNTVSIGTLKNIEAKNALQLKYLDLALELAKTLVGSKYDFKAIKGELMEYELPIEGKPDVLIAFEYFLKKLQENPAIGTYLIGQEVIVGNP